MIVLKILLVVLLVVLALVALILFFPISYSVSGKSNGFLTVHADVRWLFSIVFLRAAIDTEKKKPTVVLRIFGVPITLYPRAKKEKPEKSENRGTGDKEKPEAEPPKIEETGSNTADIPAPEVAEPPPEEPKRRAIFQRFLDWFRSIPERFRAFRQRLKGFWKKAKRILAELTDKKNKDAVRHLLAEVKFLLSHYKPRRLKTNLTFSTGDPALTGELLGVVSLVPAVYERGNHLYPDFTAEKAYLDGTFRISGHIILIYLVIAAVRLLADQNIRRLIKHVRALR